MNDTPRNTHQPQTSRDEESSVFGLSPDDIMPTKPLYKFLSTADGQSPDWKARVMQLLDGKAYLPSPSQFNDPFDCLPTVGIPKTIEEFAVGKEEFAKRIHKAKPGLTLEEIIAFVDKILAKGGLEDIAALSRQAFNMGGERMGVFCLCQEAHHVLMWSHYANNHKGIALRFNFQGQETNALGTLWRVKYQNERAKVMKFFGGGAEGNAFMEALCTKAHFWEYEKEWRYLEPDGAGTVLEFDPIVIDGVILGAKISQEDAVWMSDVAKARKLPIMHVMPDQDTFDLKFAGIWKPS